MDPSSLPIQPPQRPRRPGEAILKLGKKAYDPFTDTAWSKLSRELPEFYDMYLKELPKLITVTEGYFGGSDFDVYGTEEIIFIYCCATQPRVVAKDLDYGQGHISIPLDYPIQFEILDKRGEGDGIPRNIADIVKTQKLPVSVRMFKSTEVRFFNNIAHDALIKFRNLRLEMEYQDKYLLGYRVVKGTLADDAPCSIPLYLPIAVSVATGPKDKSVPAYQWQAMMKKLKEQASECDYSKHPMNKEIMVYSEGDIGPEKIYERIMPRAMLKQSATKPINTLPRQPTAVENPYVKRPLPQPPRQSVHPYTDLDPGTITTSNNQPRDPARKRHFIRSVGDIPKDIQNLSVSEVTDCLRLIKIKEDIVSKFRENQVNGALLCELKIEELQQEFGLTKFAARKVHMFSCDGWRPDSE